MEHIFNPGLTVIMGNQASSYQRDFSLEFIFVPFIEGPQHIYIWWKHDSNLHHLYVSLLYLCTGWSSGSYAEGRN